MTESKHFAVLYGCFSSPCCDRFTMGFQAGLMARCYRSIVKATSDEQDPIHSYHRPGTYTVSLAVTGLKGTDTETKTDFITVTEVEDAAVPLWVWIVIGVAAVVGGIAARRRLSEGSPSGSDSS